MGQDSGSAQSITTAGISGIAGDQSLRTGDATGIERIFDQNKVQRELDAQVAITAEFGKQASKAWGDYANEQFAKAVAATDEEGARCWGPDGACRAGGHALVGGLGGGVAGAAGAGLSSVMAPQVQQALVNSGIAPNAAQAITQLTVIGSGAAMGGALGAAGAANEVNNNFVFAVPVIVEGVIAGGALAARACLSSPACVRALQLGGVALVAKVAAVLTPDEVAGIPGFGAGERPKPTGPLVNIPVEKDPKDGLLVNVPQGIDTSVPGYESKKPIGTDGGTATLNPKPQLDLIMLTVPAGDKEKLNNGLQNIMEGMPVLEPGKNSSNNISRYKQGTFEDAKKVFSQLGLLNIHDFMTFDGPGKEGSLPDGTRVIVRPSSSDGAPMIQIIDINRPKPRTVQEIRFGPGKK